MAETYMEIPGSKYNDIVMLEEYRGEYALVKGFLGKDGKPVKTWGYPQKNKGPGEKSLPWKVPLGTNQQDAIKALEYFIQELGGRDAPGEPSDEEISF